jgi:hypothetical protein
MPEPGKVTLIFSTFLITGYSRLHRSRVRIPPLKTNEYKAKTQSTGQSIAENNLPDSYSYISTYLD